MCSINVAAPWWSVWLTGGCCLGVPMLLLFAGAACPVSRSGLDTVLAEFPMQQQCPTHPRRAGIEAALFASA
jgi:hypothetical protein